MKKLGSLILAFILVLNISMVINLTNVYAFTIRNSIPTSSDANWKYYSAPINNYPRSSLNGGNCTWYAYGRLYEVYGNGFCFASAGNAQEWFNLAKNNGISTGSTPRAGSLIVWGGNDYGHIAFVESVSGNAVTWTESNYQFTADKNYPAFRKYSSTHPGTYCSGVGCSLLGYIYLDGSKPNNYNEIVNGTYGIKNVGSGLMLDVADGADANKANVQIYNNNGSAAQQFKVIKSSGGYYTFQPSYSTTYMINQFAWTPTDGTNVNLYEPSGDGTQGWYFQAVSGGYIIRSAYNENLVLTATGSSSGSNVCISTYNSGNKLQIWSLTGESTSAIGWSSSAKNITETDATLVSTYNTNSTSTFWWKGCNIFSEKGDLLKQLGEDISYSGTTCDNSYNLSSNGMTLSPGTTYKYQFYANVNGTDVFDEMRSFTTKAGIIKTTGLSLSEKSKTLNVGNTFTLSATVTPSNATDKSIIYTSSNTNVATVSSNGTVTGVGSGNAVITAKTKDEGATDTCAVTVTEIKKNAEIEISNSSAIVGNDVNISVDLSSDSNIYGGEIVLSFDSNILNLKDVVAESRIAGGEYSINKDYAEGKCKIAFSGSNAVNGKIVTLNFSALNAGNCNVSVDLHKLYDEKSNEFTVTSKNGSVAISEKGSEVVEKEITISTNVITANKGGYIDIPVNISGNEGISCFNIFIDYDNTVMYPVSYTKGSNFPDMISTLDSSGNDMTALSQVRFIWDSIVNTDFNGEYFTVRFKIKDDATNGKYNITVNETGTMFTNISLDDIYYKTDIGAITVTDVIKGDVMGDGIVNGKDVVLFRQYLAGWAGVNLNSSQLLSADTTGDGAVNGKDVVLLRQYLAGWANINW